MMYSAEYDPAFYRALYALVHAEFRVRKSSGRLAHALVRPWTLRGSHVHDLATIASRGAAMPLLRWRMARAARPLGSAVRPLIAPLAGPRAAAIPTDQSALD
jgi:hypothetical protein